MPKTYSVKEAATILGFSTNTIYSFLNNKKVKGIRIGKGRFRIPQSEIDRMTGTSSVVSSTKPASTVIEPQQELIEPRPFHEKQMWLQHISLVDWYIGLGSIIFGLSMFVYTVAVEHITLPQFTSWYWVLRFVFIFFGTGFLLTKLLRRIPPVWGVVYHGAILVSFAWFTVISHFANDPQGTVVGFFICFIVGIHLFFSPSYASLISITTLFIGVLSTVLFVFFPSLFAAMLSSFGLTSSLSPWWNAALIVIPYLIYLILVKVTPKLYYFIIILGSLSCLVLGYVTGFHLYWRQGLLFLFTGLMLFAYVTWETRIMKLSKKIWMQWAVFGAICILFVTVVFSLKIFELMMYDFANRELQVKAENGKLYLETIFNYAQNSFHVYTEQNIIRDIPAKDRNTLTAYAKSLYEQFPHMYRIVILDKEGTELANYPEDQEIFGRNFAYRSYFQDALTTGQTVFSDVIQTTGTLKRYTIIMATPIMINDVVYGVIAGSFDIDELGRNLQSFVADEQGEYFDVSDRKGVRVINPNESVIGIAISKDNLAKFNDIPYWKTHLDTRFNPQGDLVLSTYRTVSYGNLNIAVVEPYSNNLRTGIIALVITIVVGVYGYLSILIVWYVCYRDYKKLGMRA